MPWMKKSGCNNFQAKIPEMVKNSFDYRKNVERYSGDSIFGLVGISERPGSRHPDLLGSGQRYIRKIRSIRKIARTERDKSNGTVLAGWITDH